MLFIWPWLVIKSRNNFGYLLFKDHHSDEVEGTVIVLKIGTSSIVDNDTGDLRLSNLGKFVEVLFKLLTEFCTHFT